jgi:hypothetical protein
MGYMETTEILKYPYLITRDTSPPRALWEFCLHSTIGRMPSDRTSRSLDASLAIPTRVLRLEAFGALRPQTGQAGFGQTATPGLRPRLCGSAE